MEKLKVLVVDDESRMRKLVSDFLKQRRILLWWKQETARRPWISFLQQKDIRSDHHGCDDAENGWICRQ